MPKILIIDDDKDYLVTLKDVLNTYKPDYEVLTAESGKEGIKLAEIGKPDVILLDINMPAMDGYEVCRRLKRNEELKQIPVVFLTGHRIDLQDRIKGLELGGDAYLTKPFDTGELFAQIEVMLRIKKVEDELRLEKESLEKKVAERTKDLDIMIKNLKESREALHDSNQLKELLLDVLTHDLKNPAGSINVLANVACEDQPKNEMLAIIKDSSDKLLQVMDNVTKLAQVALGDKIKLEKVDITEVLHSVSKEFYSQLKKSEIAFIIDIPEKLIIKANSIISEVFKNYISNAIQFVSEGKKILIDSEKRKGFLTINVKDFGITIPENKRHEVFCRGVQLEDGKKRGRGLGLAIVKRIADAHNAEVGVKPNEPTGNIFYIKIPM